MWAHTTCIPFTSKIDIAPLGVLQSRYPIRSSCPDEEVKITIVTLQQDKTHDGFTVIR